MQVSYLGGHVLGSAACLSDGAREVLRHDRQAEVRDLDVTYRHANT
jgi:hypothetical protein